MSAEAYYSEQDHCWFVPVSTELWDDTPPLALEPVRVELKDGQLWITRLEEQNGKG